MAKVSDFVHKKTVIDIDASKLKELCLNDEFKELSGLVLPLCNSEERKKLSKNNQTAKEINDKYSNKSRKIISFAGIHPECDDIPAKMKLIKDSGFLGVKIHPDYQNTFINHEGYISILNQAKELDLIVVTHAGVDDGFKGFPIKCPPELCAEVIKKTNHKKFVLGHYGAHKQWQKVLEILCYFDVYFDTAFTLGSIEENLFIDILNKHGEDKVLFATDCPWRNISSDLKIFNSYNLSQQTKDKILFKNALKLLNLDA